MATSADIARLRTMVDEPESTVYNDTALGAIIDQAGSVDLAAIEIWEQKAARYSSLVDVTESGSSRKMGDLYKNAQAMATYYRSKIEVVDPAPTTVRRAGTRTAVRK